jgi:pimeloyl-ACP methyl ester carboxylesterase
MLSKDEKLYINEHYVSWKPGKFRYWESLPNLDAADPQERAWAQQSKDKPALVFIHGYAASIEHWREAFKSLRGRYRMYGLDLLGFGYSEKLPGSKVNYSADLWAKQIRDLVAHKGEERVILVGHSMGGMAAIQCALNYPERVQALVLVDSSGLPDQGKLEVDALNQERKVKRPGFDMLMFNALSAPLLGEAAALAMSASAWAARAGLEQAYWDKSKVTPQLVEQFRAPLRTPGAAFSYLAVTRNFTKFQLPLKSGDLKLPTLIMWGEHDRAMKPEIMLPQWQKLIPQAEVYLVKDAAHCPQDEKPDDLNARLTEFVEQQIALGKSATPKHERLPRI